MKDKGLLEITHRLVVDEEYRTWFMTSPKQALVAELGISPSVYDSLVAALPILLAGGMAAAGGEPNSNDWGRRP
ncbi:MAG: hypothetical protein JXA14_25050 [Anaerolineae bacterium]|nr:hypothetical protein [Anaerolineae bacterium]